MFQDDIGKRQHYKSFRKLNNAIFGRDSLNFIEGICDCDSQKEKLSAIYNS